MEIDLKKVKRFNKFYFSELGFCGCGNPDSVVELIRDVLTCLKKRDRIEGEESELKRIKRWDESWDELKEILGDHDELFHILLYDLNRVNVLEHGGSVGGSWLTDYGREILQLLEDLKDVDTHDCYPCACDNPDCVEGDLCT